MKRILVMTFIYMLVFTLPVLAQDAPAGAPADANSMPWFAPLVGFFVTFLVSQGKRIAFVRDNPIVVATILSVLATAVPALLGAYSDATWYTMGMMTLTQLVSAIGGYELAKQVKPAAKPEELKPMPNGWTPETK